MVRSVQDSAAQAAYQANKNKKSLGAEEKLENPIRSFEEIKEMVESRFSAEDKAKLKEVGASLKKHGVSIQRTNSNAKAQNVEVAKKKNQQQAINV